MLGAIIGDIVGSRFEFNNHRSKDFELFGEGCFATDDSIMTLAVAKAIMEASRVAVSSESDYRTLLSGMTVKYMQELGRKYPNCGFGGMFYRWIFSNHPEPYNSFGNGAAMRVSPVGFIGATEQDAEMLSETVTAVTHNHDEGIKGATATSIAIYMARRGALKSEIQERIERDYYSLDFWIDDIRQAYRFNETCQETVPQAIKCFLESNSFEDAIRTAISLGGDSDTIAAITGAIAEAYYGVPGDMKEKALSYLDSDLRAIYDEWAAFAPAHDEGFKVLTKYIGKLDVVASFGEWVIDRGNDGTPEHPIQMPWVGYIGLVRAFEDEFYRFVESHPEYEHTRYGEILERHNIPWGWGSREMHEADVSGFDAQCVLALITGAIRAERFCDGALLAFFKDGSISRWLKRLKDIDWNRSSKRIEKIVFEIGGFFGGYTIYRLTFTDFGAKLIEADGRIEDSIFDTKEYSRIEAALLSEQFSAIHTEYWNADYVASHICDGEQWSLMVRYSDRQTLEHGGSNAYPSNWSKLLDFFGIEHNESENTDESLD